ncbi:hypothetical protein J7E93_33860 [Streptomyces sp. ISL-36]|uniref:hypothetical protein n=1 Tax=Streptomyces sp. ISL-36 TaxID=2819182 RepID=UPI001BEB4A4D|nr:hypothetical protein [Streptomyces sp. ISL-36]MBT2444994.1 hypothetical protein [Streptomyces sp. ISL-36]
MLTALLPALAPVASPAEQAAVTALLEEGEALVSDAPTFCPPAALLTLLVLSPNEPKETKEKRR